jgi:hypothetical protein
LSLLEIMIPIRGEQGARGGEGMEPVHLIDCGWEEECLLRAWEEAGDRRTLKGSPKKESRSKLIAGFH